MGNSKSRKQGLLALSVAAAVGAMTFVASPVIAAPNPSGKAEAGKATAFVQNVAEGESYNKFIVTYKASAANANAKGRANAWGLAAKEQGVSVKEVRTLATGATLISSSKPLAGEDAKNFMKDLVASGTVESVEPDIMLKPLLEPNDTRYNEQWDFTGQNGMRTPGAWDTSTGGGAVVAVIDTGITSHSDLNGNILPGYDFVSDASAARDGNGRDANAQDEGDWYGAGECGQGSAGRSSWHGTHVAGTVAAVTNNAKGVAGVAPDAKVVPVRVLAKCGGSLSDISDAIIWSSGGTVPGVPANANPADVINMSLGGGGSCSSSMQSAINGAVSRGTSVVVAAGNSNVDVSGSLPANCNSVIAVAASNINGGRSYYSNYGSLIDVTAPGGDTRSGAAGGILSTLNAGSTTPAGESYASYQGTSMAAPHIAGLAALMVGAKSDITPAQVEATLKDGARTLPGGCSGGCGAGLADAAATLALLGGGTDPDPDPDPEPSGNLLKNAGFEEGGASWTSNYADTFESGASARTGNGYAGLNGYGRSSSYTLDQSVTIPANVSAASLNFFLNVASNEGTSYAYDTLRVQVIDGSSTKTLATYSNRDKSSGYAEKVLDLSAYKGKTVKLRFLGVEDYSYATVFRIDDTSVTTR
ncbi:hypothetical protein GCM10027403_16220 [Arthrobacter tecti]